MYQYRRQDEKNRTVDIEVWEDPETKEIIMLRKITYYPDKKGQQVKLRTDIPKDCPEFRQAIQEEINMFQRHISYLTGKLNHNGNKKESEQDGMAFLTALFSKN